MIQVFQYVHILKGRPRKAQFRQDAAGRLIVRLHFPVIPDMAVEHAGRNRAAARPAEHIHGGVQVHGELKLQTVVDFREVEGHISRLVIHDLHIGRSARLAYIHPVYPSRKQHPGSMRQLKDACIQLLHIAKAGLGTGRHKVTRRKLPGLGPGRRGHQPLQAVQLVAVPGAVRKYRAAVFIDSARHAARCNRISQSVVFRERRPGNAPPSGLLLKEFQ